MNVCCVWLVCYKLENSENAFGLIKSNQINCGYRTFRSRRCRFGKYDPFVYDTASGDELRIVHSITIRSGIKTVRNHCYKK